MLQHKCQVKAKNPNMKSDPTLSPHAHRRSRPDLQPGLLSDAELLGSLLYPQQPKAKATRQAEKLLRKFGGLRGLQIASRLASAEREGFDDSQAQLIRLGHEVVRRQLKQTLQRGVSLTSPAMTMEYLQTVLRDRNREIFTCLFLDTRHRVIASEDLFQGSIDGACVYPRVVAERALRLSAAAVIVAHNHPSGVSEPSLADQAITRRLKDALLLLEIRLLDHFVVGDGPPVSMASRGML
jgi:DNA repair protein RadC